MRAQVEGTVWVSPFRLLFDHFVHVTHAVNNAQHGIIIDCTDGTPLRNTDFAGAQDGTHFALELLELLLQFARHVIGRQAQQAMNAVAGQPFAAARAGLLKRLDSLVELVSCV